MNIEDLSQEEIKMILASREAKKREEAIAHLEQHVLETASRYIRWLRENGAGDTFSTFVDEFGYEDVPESVDSLGVRRDTFWRIVQAVMKAVDETTKEYI